MAQIKTYPVHTPTLADTFPIMDQGNTLGVATLSELFHTYVDIDYPIIIRSTGPNIPSITTLYGGLTAPFWQVNDIAVCEGQELVHSWEEGSAGSVHMHIYTGALSAVNTYINIELEIGVTSFNEVFTTTVVQSGDLLIPANTPARTHKIFHLYDLDLTGKTIASHVKMSIKRIASSGTAANDYWCEMMQIHVIQDTTGSKSLTTKV